MYRVVFEGLGGPDSMPLGTRCITEYKSEEDFESRINDSLKVIAKDVSFEHARRLCDEVSGNTLARAAFERGTNEGNMQMHLFNFSLAAQNAGKLEEFHREVKVILLEMLGETLN